MKDGAQWLKDNTDIKLVGIDYLWVAAYDDLIPSHLVFLENRVIRAFPWKVQYTLSVSSYWKCCVEDCVLRKRMECREERPTMSLVVGKLENALEFQELHDLKLPQKDEELDVHDLLRERVERRQLLELEYRDILKAAVPSLVYTSADELKVLLSNGFHLNGGKTWFSVNGKGEHRVLISIKECLIPDAGKRYKYTSEHNSRFAGGNLDAFSARFNTRIKAQFLSPFTTYAVNLVFKFETRNGIMAEQRYIGLEYKLDGETKTSVSSLAYKSENNWWEAQLYQFTSDHETTIDFEIIFVWSWSCVIEGIEFQPLEIVEVERNMSEVEMQPDISDSDDTDWEQKLPNDYEEIIKWSKDRVQWSTKKELYSILCKGFLINHGSLFEWIFNNSQQWFFLDNNGKKCLMVSARAAFLRNIEYASWKSSPESRFGEVLVTDYRFGHAILKENEYRVLSPQTRYATYFVYKLLPESKAGLVEVEHKGELRYYHLDIPQIPVIRPKVNQNSHKPLNRLKIEDLPKQRTDGWWEVQICEFQTNNSVGIVPSLKLERVGFISGLIMQGIELRPV